MGNSATPYSLRYKDAVNTIHGPFSYGKLQYISTIAPSYNTRKLRKHYKLDFDDENTFNQELWNDMIYQSEYVIEKPLDSLWAIKSVEYHNNNVQKYHYSYTFLWGTYLVNAIIFAFQITVASLSDIPWTVLIIIIIQHISIILTILIWKLITFYLNTSKVNKPKYESRYHQILSWWNNEFNTLTFYEFMKLLFNPFKWCKNPKCKCFLNIISNILCCLLPNIMVWMVMVRNYPDDMMKWVVPDYYDLQQDLEFFILKKLENVIDRDSELMRCIYHILNAVIGSEMIILWTLRPNKDDGVTMDKIVEMKESYIYCLKQYLRNKVCLNHADINYDEHTFDHKYICLEDWKYYQYINGYKYNKYQFISFILRCAHKYMIPLIPFVFIINVSEFVALHIIATNDIGTLFLEIAWYLFIFLMIIMIILEIYEYYGYLNEFENITQNIQFWISPEILMYLKKYRFDRSDIFITATILHSIASIEMYLNELHENHIYYESFMEYDHIFSDDVAQIILDYICQYKAIDISSNVWNWIYNIRNVKPSYPYDVDKLNKEINDMIQRIGKLNIDDLNENKEGNNDNIQFATHKDGIYSSLSTTIP